MIGDFFDVLDMSDLVIRVDDENGAAFDTPLFDQRPVRGSERSVLWSESIFTLSTAKASQYRFCANGRSMLIVKIFTFGSFPASVLKRFVCISQTGVSSEGSTLKMRTRFAGVLELHRLEAPVHHFKVRRLIARFQFGAD